MLHEVFSTSLTFSLKISRKRRARSQHRFHYRFCSGQFERRLYCCERGCAFLCSNTLQGTWSAGYQGKCRGAGCNGYSARWLHYRQHLGKLVETSPHTERIPLHRYGCQARSRSRWVSLPRIWLATLPA
jgi:hypothetical protein